MIISTSMKCCSFVYFVILGVFPYIFYYSLLKKIKNNNILFVILVEDIFPSLFAF